MCVIEMIQCNLLLVLSRMTTIEALSGYRKLTDKKKAART